MEQQALQSTKKTSVKGALICWATSGKADVTPCKYDGNYGNKDHLPVHERLLLSQGPLCS
jgi:hypothetical protein